MQKDDSISSYFSLTPVQTSALRRLGVLTISDILYHFPARYEAEGVAAQSDKLVSGTKVTLYGKLSNLKAKKLWKSRRPATEGWFEDGEGRVKILWFNQPYIAKMAPQDTLVKLTGTVAGKDKPYITNPEIEVASALPAGLFEKARSSKPETLPAGGQGRSSLFPVYPESRGISSKWFYHALQRVFASGIFSRIEDPIPKDIRERYHLPELAAALVWIHAPEKQSHAEAARKRFAFEEIFTIQAAKAQERALNDTQISFPIQDAPALARRFFSSLDFPPTYAQERATSEILNDFEKLHPMARLLEGDVGSGKTLVAAATAYAVVNSRPQGREFGTLQVAYMAPTEILASQHFQSFIEYFADLPINIALITGSGCWKFPSKSAGWRTRSQATAISRAQLLKWVENGEIAMVVGTHALIQKSVRFKHLAYAIVDEQHRFGINQRKALIRRESEAVPHFLSMTATPIPRTFALTLYGDLDLSVLDELPPGRAKVKTQIVTDKSRESAYEIVRRELRAGRQAFVVCPRIEEPDPAKMNALQAKSAKAEAKRLQKDVFPEYKIGLLHGAMVPKEKEGVMRDFASGKILILVATSVVEVGINVPNATVMMVEGAERFGLAQLHQLRGRIMRSSHPPYCFLLPFASGQISSKRLKALEKSDDGFALAEADLEARGAGDLFGRRQWGISDIGMEALKNPRLIQAAREEAHRLVREGRTLAKYPSLAERIKNVSRELHFE